MSKKRTDMVRVGDRYYYELCSKCLGPKVALKTNYCQDCAKFMRDRLKSKKIDGDIFNTEPLKNLKEIEDDLINFVNLIDSRNGMASFNEIFVDLITHYNIFRDGRNIDSFSVNDQLILMWDVVRKEKNRIESKRSKRDLSNLNFK